jgi:hypothetical protein
MSEKKDASSGKLKRTLLATAPLAVALVAGRLLTPSVNPPSGTAPQPAAHLHTAAGAPVPLLKEGQSAEWWFVFKFNTATLPGCADSVARTCPFGGAVQPYKHFSQQFAFASNRHHALQQGGGCLGDATTDPVGATFDQVYNGQYFYVLWNDQFYGDPMSNESSPAGHSKGLLAWDKEGDGLVMQVSTPSWPASGSAQKPRTTDGNTLGCVKDNDVLVSQHFFSLKLNKDDVVAVLQGLGNASVVTDPNDPQVVNNGGPTDIQVLVRALGGTSKSKTPIKTKLSTGVTMISKPSHLEVPPWQMISALLGGEPLRVASWWAHPEIPSTVAATKFDCWDASLGKPGDVQVATTGSWEGATIGLEGGPESDGNHAKVGVSTGAHPYAIFGDMNQQGKLAGDCHSSQNGRGGLFYVVEDAGLAGSIKELLQGDSAPQ